MKWYRADYDNQVDSEYFIAESDEQAIEQAKSKTEVEYSDVGMVKCELVELFEVDDNTEFFNEIRLVWG